MDDRDRLETLLARGRLSGAERERILGDALAAAGAAPAWWRRRALWLLAPTLAAATAVALVVRLDGGFRARGAAAAVHLEVGCRDGACRPGGLLLFRVEGAAAGGFLSAYAEPERGGERLWYFPLEDGTAPEVAAQPAPQILRLGVPIGREHPPGRYRVHLVLSRDRPAPRAAGADVIATRTASLEVLP